jgi:hypothetical protein
MKASAGTMPTTFSEQATQRRYRNQATGIGQTRAASERTGAVRSQVAIDCAPPAQLAVVDRSYPRPAPVFDPATGTMRDKVTGGEYKAESVGPQCYSTSLGALR